MSVIALVGVSGSGKTILMNELTNKLDKCAGVAEATRGEILEYCNLPIKDTEEFSHKQLVKYDIGRVELSMKMERVFLAGEFKHVVFEKPAIIPLMYFLQYSSRFATPKVIDSLVKDVIRHSGIYNLIYHLPANSFDTSKDNLNRNITNSWVLSAQNAILHEMLTWLWKPYISLETTHERSVIVTRDATNFVFRQEQRKVAERL